MRLVAQGFYSNYGGWGSDNEACSSVMGTVSTATKVGGAQIMRLVAQCGNSFCSN